MTDKKKELRSNSIQISIIILLTVSFFWGYGVMSIDHADAKKIEIDPQQIHTQVSASYLNSIMLLPLLVSALSLAILILYSKNIDKGIIACSICLALAAILSVFLHPDITKSELEGYSNKTAAIMQCIPAVIGAGLVYYSLKNKNEFAEVENVNMFL